MIGSIVVSNYAVCQRRKSSDSGRDPAGWTLPDKSRAIIFVTNLLLLCHESTQHPSKKQLQKVGWFFRGSHDQLAHGF